MPRNSPTASRTTSNERTGRLFIGDTPLRSPPIAVTEGGNASRPLFGFFDREEDDDDEDRGYRMTPAGYLEGEKEEEADDASLPRQASLRYRGSLRRPSNFQLPIREDQPVENLPRPETSGNRREDQAEAAKRNTVSGSSNRNEPDSFTVGTVNAPRSVTNLERTSPRSGGSEPRHENRRNRRGAQPELPSRGTGTSNARRRTATHLANINEPVVSNRRVGGSQRSGDESNSNRPASDNHSSGIDRSATVADRNSAGANSNLAGAESNLAGAESNLAGVESNLAGAESNLAGTGRNSERARSNLAGRAGRRTSRRRSGRRRGPRPSRPQKRDGRH